MTAVPGNVEDLLRELAPQVLAALVRRYGQFHLCEDASQEALLAAALQWPGDGIPENPRGWLITVASRRLMDQVRSEQSRRTREDRIAVATPQSELLAPPADAGPADGDDSLALLFGCCHPELSAPSQIALTLARSAGCPPRRSRRPSGCPRRRWRSASAAPSRRSKRPGLISPCRQPGRSGPSGCAPCCTCSTSSSMRATPPLTGTS